MLPWSDLARFDAPDNVRAKPTSYGEKAKPSVPHDSPAALLPSPDTLRVTVQLWPTAYRQRETSNPPRGAATVGSYGVHLY
jgi:hypothetical protein